MEPVPETAAAFRMLETVDGAFEDYARETSRRVGELVPDAVGLSIALAHQELTFTLVATGSTVAGLDALQYLTGGPCVESRLTGGSAVHRTGDLLDEGKWQLFAAGEAMAGIGSSLSMPLNDDGDVVGSLNIYASSPDAFEGRREQLAELLGAWEPAMVANADLGFTTRLRAAAAPLRLEEQDLVGQAVGVLLTVTDLDRESAMSRLREAAAQAGISAAHLARLVVDAQRQRAGD